MEGGTGKGKGRGQGEGQGIIYSKQGRKVWRWVIYAKCLCVRAVHSDTYKSERVRRGGNS